MMEALIGAIKHSVVLAKGPNELKEFADQLQMCMHAQLLMPGQGSRDISGPTGLTTEQFVAAVRKRLDNLRA